MRAGGGQGWRPGVRQRAKTLPEIRTQLEKCGHPSIGPTVRRGCWPAEAHHSRWKGGDRMKLQTNIKAGLKADRVQGADPGQG